METKKYLEEETQFYIDVPPTNGSDEWHHVATFKTKKEAIEYAKKHFGADENGMISIVSES